MAKWMLPSCNFLKKNLQKPNASLTLPNGFNASNPGEGILLLHNSGSPCHFLQSNAVARRFYG